MQPMSGQYLDIGDRSQVLGPRSAYPNSYIHDRVPHVVQALHPIPPYNKTSLQKQSFY